MDQGLLDAGLFDCAPVLIERGIPMSSNQFQIKFYLYEISKAEPFSEFHADVIDIDLK